MIIGAGTALTATFLSSSSNSEIQRRSFQTHEKKTMTLLPHRLLIKTMRNLETMMT